MLRPFRFTSFHSLAGVTDVAVPLDRCVRLVCASVATSGAQAPPVTAIRAARLIVGDGTQIESPIVLVAGDRITAVGTAAQVSIPAGATIIDLPGHTPAARLHRLSHPPDVD